MTMLLFRATLEPPDLSSVHDDNAHCCHDDHSDLEHSGSHDDNDDGDIDFCDSLL